MPRKKQIKREPVAVDIETNEYPPVFSVTRPLWSRSVAGVRITLPYTEERVTWQEAVRRERERSDERLRAAAIDLDQQAAAERVRVAQVAMRAAHEAANVTKSLTGMYQVEVSPRKFVYYDDSDVRFAKKFMNEKNFGNHVPVTDAQAHGLAAYAAYERFHRPTKDLTVIKGLPLANTETVVRRVKRLDLVEKR